MHRDICDDTSTRKGEAMASKMKSPTGHGPRQDRTVQEYQHDTYKLRGKLKEHPLSRIMGIERRPEGLVISTTDTHLPRRIGEALKHAYTVN